MCLSDSFSAYAVAVEQQLTQLRAMRQSAGESHCTTGADCIVLQSERRPLERTGHQTTLPFHPGDVKKGTLCHCPKSGRSRDDDCITR